MNKVLPILILCSYYLPEGCREKMDPDEVLQIGVSSCQQSPGFFRNTGLDQKHTAFSTSEKKVKGLALVQLPENPADTTGRKIWQHPGWNRFGYMGAITTDENGNAYTIPVPVVNVLDNPFEKQNTIYKVSSFDGEMRPLTELPMAVNNNHSHGYGLLGIYYDCHAQKIYASSIAGSNRESEKGAIYAIDPSSGKITDQLTGWDAMGLCVGGVVGQKRLYFGSARTSDLYSVELTKSGQFISSVKREFTLDLLGPRGDDKARRIRFDKHGNMVIFGVEFNYNLTAPTEKQETIYRFRFDQEDRKWILSE